MQKAVMLSLRPEWVEQIVLGKKKFELRKTYPKQFEAPPFVCYVYMTKKHWGFKLLRAIGKTELADRLEMSTGKVVGKFVCRDVDIACFPSSAGPVCNETIIEHSAVEREKVIAYGGKKPVYAWKISCWTLYDRPIPLSEFFDRGAKCGTTTTKPPQSWCYVEEV